jgi:DNA-directed RNA polymerase specialized sigma24 family protein
MLSDTDLVAGLRSEDPAAVDALVTRYWERTYRVAYQFTHDPGSAADVAQETFVHALKTVNQLRRPESFRPWLFRMLEGTAKQHARALGRRSAHEGRWRPRGGRVGAGHVCQGSRSPRRPPGRRSPGARPSLL